MCRCVWCPFAALGQAYGVSAPGIDSMIRLACVITAPINWRRGRTLDKLGIEGLSVNELARFVNEGV
jgi:opine dehydrogenase